MSNDATLKLMPEEARELRAATERLISGGLAWLSGATPDGDEGQNPSPSEPGSVAPPPAPPFPPK